MSMEILSSIVHWGIWGLQVSLKYDMLCYCIAAKMFSGFIGSVVFLSTLSTINNWFVWRKILFLSMSKKIHEPSWKAVSLLVDLESLETILHNLVQKTLSHHFSEFNHDFPIHLNISMHILPTVNYKIA